MFIKKILQIINIKNFNQYQKPILLMIIISFIASLIVTAIAIINSPNDYQQSNAVKIMYIHVPSAWMSLIIYSLMACFNICGFIFRNRFFYLISQSIAKIGLVFTATTLITGAIWGRPIWGTWWAWDARLTSMLILFFLYCGYILTVNNFDNMIKGEKVAAIISIIGFINIPFIKFSVEYFNSLHQPASIIRSKGVAIHPAMLKPLLLSFITCFLYFLLITMIDLKTRLIASKINRKINIS